MDEDVRCPSVDRRCRRDKYRKLRLRSQEHYRSMNGADKPPIPKVVPNDKGDNSDDGSARGGYSSGQEVFTRESSKERTNDGTAGHTGQQQLPIQTQPRSKPPCRPVPRRHTVVGATQTGKERQLQETERSKEAFMDMLTTRYPQYAEKISSTASEDGFPIRVSTI